ncbi:hypothetical protein MNBD_GAMMA13-231 [hydrothermal vent metagenome]|uniref:Uncharacterized protein n=1 Tax=hydrothermal vent metagenome TaxID=652676 RepID=A0A3B0YQK7_9ZZZZ
MLHRMHFTQDNCNSDRLIRAYDGGLISIAGQRFSQSLILARDHLISDWRPQQVTELQREDFDPVLDIRPEVLILGTGGSLTFPSAALTAQLLQSGIGVEVMDTAAACRTYNILLSEQRHVVAALLPGTV